MYPLTLLITLTAHAHAAPHGLVVHLDAGAQALVAPVSLELTTDAGKPFTVTLNDSGAQPDVVAGDSAWSGVGMVEGTTAVRVALTAGTFTAAGADLAFPADKEANLDLQLLNGRIVAGTSSAPNAPTPAEAGSAPVPGTVTPHGPPEPPNAETPRAVPSGPAAPAGASPIPHSPRRDRSSDAMLYIGFGAGALLLAGLGYVLTARLSRGAAPGALPRGVRRVAERGYLGAGTPGLAPGLSQWLVGPDDEADLLAFLAAHIARSRPVLVHTAAPVELPAAWGGPVYTASLDKPGRLGDAVDALLENHPGLVIVLAGVEGPELTRWSADLTDDLPVYALVRTPIEGDGPVVGCTRAPGGWTLNCGDTRVVVANPPGAPPLDGGAGAGVPS